MKAAINMIEDGAVTPFIVVTGHGMDISDRTDPPYVNLATKYVSLHMMEEPGLFIEDRADAVDSMNCSLLSQLLLYFYSSQLYECSKQVKQHTLWIDL